MNQKYDHVSAIIDFENGSLNEEQTIELFQYLIDSGLAWELQGSYGRLAERLIDSGYCFRANTINR